MSAAATAAAATSTTYNHLTEQALANEFLNFVNQSPSQFHATETAVSLLKQAGFEAISERQDASWAAIKPNGRYFFTRNQSTVVAFAVGAAWKKGAGFTIAAAHTDSPVLKVKPVSKTTKHGFLQVGVECYGGGLWYTWFDRDLSLAGRVIVKNSDGTYESKLVHIKRPILRIPNLAIHLNREVNDKGFAPNKQSHVLPILATAVKAQLDGPKTEEKSDKPATSNVIADEHQPLLLNIIATELGVDVASIRDFELCLYDTQPAIVGGALNEFIYSRALDNLMMSFVSLRALIDSSSPEDLRGESTIRMVALFDNEEIGSESVNGAGSNMMSQLLARINGDSSSYDSAIRRSFLVSADMAHALHPNYAEVHEENHRPHIHKGLVVKNNANLRYATNAVSSFFISEIARKHNIPLQKFAVRNDMGCGSTIGPILSANCGIRTVDVGIPQLSMHSIREMCGVGDVFLSYQLLHRVYHEFSTLDQHLKIEHEQ